MDLTILAIAAGVAGANAGIAPYPAPRPGRRQPGLGAVRYQRAFQLGHGSQNLQREHALGRGGVDRIAQGPEMRPLLFQGLDHLQQVGDRASQAVYANDLQNVAGLHLQDQPGKLRACTAGAGRLFDD